MAYLLKGIPAIRTISFGDLSITSLSFTVSKNGGALATPVMSTLTQIAGNVYRLDLSSSDLDTDGDLYIEYTDSILGIVAPSGGNVSDQVGPGIPANVTAVQDSVINAGKFSDFLGAGYDDSVHQVNSVGTVTGSVNGSVVGSVGSVAGDIGGNIIGSVAGNVGGVVASVVVSGGSIESVTGSVGSVASGVMVSGTIDANILCIDGTPSYVSYLNDFLANCYSTSTHQVAADMRAINGGATDGNNATLSLKSINVTNDSGNAVELNGSSCGLIVEGQGDVGLVIYSDTDTGLWISGAAHGAYIHGGQNGVHADGGQNGYYGYGSYAGAKFEGNFEGMCLIGETRGLCISSANMGIQVTADTGLQIDAGDNAMTINGSGNGIMIYGGTGAGISSSGAVGMVIAGSGHGIDISGTDAINIAGTNNGVVIDGGDGDGIYTHGLAQGLNLEGGNNGIRAASSGGLGLNIAGYTGGASIDTYNGNGLFIHGPDNGLYLQGDAALRLDGGSYGSFSTGSTGHYTYGSNAGVQLYGNNSGYSINGVENSALRMVTRNRYLSGFHVTMLSTDNTIAPEGLTVTILRKGDGGSWGPLEGTPSTTDAHGTAVVDLTDNDTNANVITLLYSAPGCQDRVERILTQAPAWYD